MPNYIAIAEEMIRTLHWTHEGITTDGTELLSCPECGAAIPAYLQLKHAHWHAVKDNVDAP